MPAIRTILAAHDNDGPVTGVDIVGPYVRHIVTNHRALVSTIDGEVVAYGAVVDAGVALFLADMFVDPGRLGQGIGRPLLTALFGGAPRLATFASADPRALPLYARAGMAPLWLGLSMDGPSTAIDEEAGYGVERAEPLRLAEIERAWGHPYRPVDHAFWGSQPEADAFLVVDAEGPVASGYGRARQGSDARAVDRLVIRPGADPVRPALAALRRVGRGGFVDSSIPGPSPLLQALLARGFMVTDRNQYMATSGDIVDPLRLLPNVGML